MRRLACPVQPSTGATHACDDQDGPDAQRRHFLKALGAAGLGLQAAGHDAHAATRPRNYNVLWLMADEHNPFVAGFAGDPHIATPAMDSIARSGMKFTAAYSPNPVCVPARQAFHSGRMGSNIDFAAENYEALGPYFTRKGFETGWFGKQHWEELRNDFLQLGPKNSRLIKEKLIDAGKPIPEESRLVSDASVASWGTGFNEDNLTTDQALNFLDQIGDRRFFLGVSYVKPHFPFCIQSRYFERYANVPIPEPRVTRAMLEDLSTAMKNDRIEYGIDKLTAEESTFCRAIYYGMISYLDDQISRVMTRLDRLELRHKTIVIYMADHGEMMGQHGIWYKNAFFEGSVRIPLLIALPRALGAPRHARSDAPVSAIDLFPTLCELCDLAPPPTLEGHSVVDLLMGTDDGATRVAFAENARSGIPARMIRTADFKYCHYADGFEQLYDMRGADRDAERVNLAQDPVYLGIKADLNQRALDGWNAGALLDDNS